MHRSDIKAVHEPYADPFYWGPERMSPRFSDKECEGHAEAKTSFADISQQLLEVSIPLCLYNTLAQPTSLKCLD